MLHSIELGKDGVWFGNLKLKFKRNRFVVDEPVNGQVVLHNPNFRMPLWSDGRYVYTSLWGTVAIFEPFLNIGWLRNWIGLITESDLPFILEDIYSETVEGLVAQLV